MLLKNVIFVKCKDITLRAESDKSVSVLLFLLKSIKLMDLNTVYFRILCYLYVYFQKY